MIQTPAPRHAQATRPSVLLMRLVTLALLCPTLAFINPADAAAPPTPVAQWDLHPGKTTGNRIKATRGNLNASIVGPVRFSKDKPVALLFDGNSKARHKVTVTDNIATAGLPKRIISAEAWVMIDKTMAWGGIVGALQDNGNYEKGWLLGFKGSQFFFAVSSMKVHRITYMTSPRFFETGHWYHLVGTYDGVEQRLYVDGQLVAKSKTQQGDIDYPPKAFYSIGAYHDDDELHTMHGRIESISIYNRALTPVQVAARFNQRKDQFPGIIPQKPKVQDWPTYLRDNQRTGLSDDTLKLPMKLLWVHKARHAPEPAWPPPAKQDFWHKKASLQPRVVFDRVFHTVAVGDRVYFGSSADDTVYCLDARTGRKRWSFTAQGPVRLAPSIVENRVLFGSDDGNIYCLDAEQGKLIWKQQVAPKLWWIPGNQRVISAWPVRSGVLIDGSNVYACAGIFPSQGVYQGAWDWRTGKRIDAETRTLNVSPQGYMARLTGQLRVTTGRDPKGAFVTALGRDAKGMGQLARVVEQEHPYAFIGAGAGSRGLWIAGGQDKIAAFNNQTGKKLWAMKVEGKAYSLAVAQSRLLVSTDRGFIYCFVGTGTAARGKRPIITSASKPRPPVYPSAFTKSKNYRRAAQLLKDMDLTQGYCLVLNSDEGQLAYELAKASTLRIVGLEPDAAKVARSRKMLDEAGLYGRVVIQHGSIESLAYTDYLFNLVTNDRPMTKPTAAYGEQLKRIARPGAGLIALQLIDKAAKPVATDAAQWTSYKRPPLENVGEWSHLHADPSNTVCSTDELVGGQMALQWFGPPGPREMVDRHHRTSTPLWKDGRLFIPGANRVIAADAYNGALLWNVEVPRSIRVAAFRDSGQMAVGKKHLYVASAGQCLGIDVKTGKTTMRFKAPRVRSGADYEWGYVATADGLLFGSSVKPEGSRRQQSRKIASTETHWDFVPIVCSDYLFAFDSSKPYKPLWTYRKNKGLIINPTLTLGGGSMFFVESNNPRTLEIANGRARLSELVGKGANIVALNARTGKLLWKLSPKLPAQHNLYMAYAGGKLVVVGSYNGGTDKKKSKVLFDIKVLDAATGKTVWQHTQTQNTGIGGSHGEQDHHPVIVGDKLYCEPFAYNLHTGKALAEWAWSQKKRSGCGNISASARSFFFRQSNPTMFDLKLNKYTKVTTVSRPGCWVNMIPAGGLLLIPEASSGCTCNYAIQGSMAFRPITAPAPNK